MEKFTSDQPLNSVNDQADVVVMTAHHRDQRQLRCQISPMEFKRGPLPAAGNCNTPAREPFDDDLLCPQLPEVIQSAVEEWGIYLQTMNWLQRRPLIEKFSSCFADNYRQQKPSMTAAEYASLKDLGFTCLLEHLDSGDAVTNSHQARCFEASMHVRHQERAATFWRSNRSRLMVVQ